MEIVVQEGHSFEDPWAHAVWPKIMIKKKKKEAHIIMRLGSIYNYASSIHTTVTKHPRRFISHDGQLHLVTMFPYFPEIPQSEKYCIMATRWRCLAY